MAGRPRLGDRVIGISEQPKGCGRYRLRYVLDGKRRSLWSRDLLELEERAARLRAAIAGTALQTAPSPQMEPSPPPADASADWWRRLIQVFAIRVARDPSHEPSARALRALTAAARADAAVRKAHAQPKAPGSHEDGKGDTEEITDEELLVELERQAACCRSRLEARRDGGNGHTRPETT